ncbi:hypothetical protein [Solidesulfovibrio carbinoliphilus]|nr:hypothetical protein [Solidesulfovibrio carbinoliphilus]
MSVTFGTSDPYKPMETTRTLNRAGAKAEAQASRRARGLAADCCRGMGRVSPAECVAMFRAGDKTCTRDGGCSMGRLEDMRRPDLRAVLEEVRTIEARVVKLLAKPVKRVPPPGTLPRSTGLAIVVTRMLDQRPDLESIPLSKLVVAINAVPRVVNLSGVPALARLIREAGLPRARRNGGWRLLVTDELRAFLRDHGQGAAS